MIRFLPTSIYDLPAIEDWLSEQAERGRIFDGFYGPWAIFRKGEPQHLTYRLEPNDGNNVPGDEREAAYAQAGWEFLLGAAVVKLWVFVANRPDPVPIHTDPVTEGIACERLERQARRMMLEQGLLGLVWLLALVYIFTDSRGDGWHRYDIHYCLYWTSYVVIFFLLRRVDYIAVRRLIGSLKAGVRPEGGRRRWPYRWLYGALFAMALLTVLDAILLYRLNI